MYFVIKVLVTSHILACRWIDSIGNDKKVKNYRQLSPALQKFDLHLHKRWRWYSSRKRWILPSLTWYLVIGITSSDMKKGMAQGQPQTMQGLHTAEI